MKTDLHGDKKVGRTKKVVYGAIIFLMLSVAILLIVTTVKGVNVFEMIEKLPVISEQAKNEKGIENNEKQISELQAKLKNEEAKALQLEAELKKKEQEIKKIEDEKLRLEQQLMQAEETVTEGPTDKSYLSMVKTYEAMSPKNAAQILIEMDEDIAIEILADIKEEQLAKILEKMPAQKAASFSNKLANQD